MECRTRSIGRVRMVNDLFISEQNADHAKSMEILARNGLRPLTYQEALSHSSELVKELKGKWFWLSGKGLKESGFYTFDGQGKLTGLTGKEMPYQKVCVFPGDQPLSLGIYTDAFGGGGFTLNADYYTTLVASVVVGVKTSFADAAKRAVRKE